MDSKQRDDFVDDINDEYEEVREDHYDGLKVTSHIFQTTLCEWSTFIASYP